AIRRERRDRMGKSNSLVCVSALSNGERPPYRRRDEQCAGRDGWRHRNVYPGEIAGRQSGERREQSRSLISRHLERSREVPRCNLELITRDSSTSLGMTVVAYQPQSKTHIELAAVMCAAAGQTGDCA